MKTIFTAVATALSISSAVAAPEVMYSFGNESLENYFKEQKYTQSIQQAAEETFGSIGDKYTITLIGDYGTIDGGKRCVYFITGFISSKYKNNLIINLDTAGVSRSAGSALTSTDDCKAGVDKAIQYVAAQSIIHIKEAEEIRQNKKLQQPVPKNQKQI